jgi:hypothetical protein
MVGKRVRVAYNGEIWSLLYWTTWERKKMGDVLETAIPILGGLYATLLGFRVIENGHKYERQLRILGPLLIVFGVLMLFKALSHYYL